MKKKIMFASITVLILGLTTLGMADEGHKMVAPATGGIRAASKEEQMKVALSAAPAPIAQGASVMVYGEEGKLVEAKKGTNGFTCIPDISGLPTPDPICNDPAGTQWFNDMLSGAPKPTNTLPGISYMASGGWHFEKEGKVVMQDGHGVKKVQEPPHWMFLWPFDQKTTGLPQLPTNALGTYVMFEGTPYAHLMVYQNPKGIQ
ncbi:MAG: hypothetical protein HY282_05065 [Nitrospirae bacterium]|nr:hypothetical protein [Candidatus Manganitrophaceae bacterium]